MGCTQSTERKPDAAEAKPEIAQAKPVEVLAAVATVVVESETPAVVAEATEPTVIATPTANQEKAAPVEVIQSPIKETHVDPVFEAAAPTVPVAPIIPVAAVPAVVPTSTPVEPTKEASKENAPASAMKGSRAPLTPLKAKPAVPVLSLIASPNVVPKAGKRSARGFGPNVQESIQAASKKTVAFGSVLPVPVDAALKRKTKARKAAGKHFGNVQEDILLASIAAFERQLTHRSSLDAQLRS